MICEEKIDANSRIRICPTCVIIAMPDKDFEDAHDIGIIHNQNIQKLTDRELKKILDLFLPYQGEVMIKTVERKKISG
jgi:hypothetical protein